MSCLEKWTSRIAVIVTAGVVCWLMLHNWKSKEFFDASFTTCISIIIAVGISYLLSQRQTDKRKQKEILQSVLKALQDRINDPGAYSITESLHQKASHQGIAKYRIICHCWMVKKRNLA
jgi:hypothetical protein